MESTPRCASAPCTNSSATIRRPPPSPTKSPALSRSATWSSPSEPVGGRQLLPFARDRPPRQRLVEQLRRHGRDGGPPLTGQHPQPVVNLVRQVQLATLRRRRDGRTL